MKEIGRGAEAVLYKDGEKLIKDRIKKGYRIPQLDEKIRSERSRHEAKLMTDAMRFGINVPRIMSEKNFKIEMEFIEGKRLKELINSDIPKEEVSKLAFNIGEQIGKLHSNNIIHGDLTTSNMILKNNKIFLIDFGLASPSGRLEDQGTDLAVLKEAFKSTHFKRLELLWQNLMLGYKSSNANSDKVLNVLKSIEKRGRYIDRGEK